uniref:Nose resistant to fluoxetine protein 6 n=1 Tax=Culex pipiens TaxID=7175 RepID=A0A8D8BCP9_CULPI
MDKPVHFLKKISVICFIINYSLVECIEPSTTSENEKYQLTVGYDDTRVISRKDCKTVIVDEPNELNSIKKNKKIGIKHTHQVIKYNAEPLLNNSHKQEQITPQELNYTTKVSLNLFHIFMNLYDHQSWNLTPLKNKISYDCAADMQIYLQHLNLQTNWALKVFDSSGHYGGQSLFGNDFWLGSKSFCEEINEKNSESKTEPFVHMSFFVAIIRAKILQLTPETKLLHLGQCLPKSCSKEEVQCMLKEDPNSILLKHKDVCELKNSSSKTSCNLLDVINIRNVPGAYSLYEDTKFYILCATIMILAGIILLSSYQESLLKMKTKIHQNEQLQDSLNGFEKWMEKNNFSIELNTFKSNNSNSRKSCIEESSVQECNNQPANKLIEILKCFSIHSNSKSILSISASSEGSITCIHGLRLYSLLWTVMVHSYLQLYAVGENRYRRTITERSFIYQIVGNATFSVDTFFFISGMLVVVLFFRSAKKINTFD